MHIQFKHTPKERFITPIDDLLRNQRRGKFVSPEDKKRIQEYASSQRLKNKSKKAS